MEILSKITELLNKIRKDNVEDDIRWKEFYDNDTPLTLNYHKGSIYDAFHDAYLKYPDYKACTYFGNTISYKELNDEILRAAKSLKALGVSKGDKVTICMPNTLDAIIMFYAINLVGGIANMIHPLSSTKEIEYYLTKVKSEYIMCLDLMYSKIEPLLEKVYLNKVIVTSITNMASFYVKVGYKLKSKKVDIKYNDTVISYKDFIEAGSTFTGKYKYHSKMNDDAVILYSGGTTGDPKGVVLSNLNFNALALQSFTTAKPAKAGDSVLTIMPIFHGFGIGVCVHTELITGMNIILIPQFDKKKFASLIKKYHPVFLAGVPTMYESLVNSKEKSKTYLSSVVNVICGGDTLNETLKNKVDQYLKTHGSKTTIRVGYGLTECTGASCLTPRYYFKEGALGVPFPDTIYKIFKTGTFKESEPLEEGEICIYGPTVMSRYLDDPVETKNVLKKHSDGKTWLHTGDIGYMDQDGIVFFKSRLKRIIVVSGYNVYPQYVEKVIMSHPAVLTCTVIGIPHQYKKQVPKAYIILRNNFKLTKELKDDIKSYTEKSIAKYSLPYEYEYVTEIPTTKVGKVAFKELEKRNQK